LRVSALLAVLKLLKKLSRAFGLASACNLLLRQRFGRSDPVMVRKGPFRLAVRPLDSDISVAVQIFSDGEYAIDRQRTKNLVALATRWKSLGKTPVIIDAGANVGYSAVFFAEQFPSATILAVEPDPATFAVLKANAAACDRIHPINAALWKHDDGVELANGNDLSWARSVIDRGKTPSITVASLLATVPDSALLVLKLDIEGAEREVCEEAGALLRGVPCILVEPHDWINPGSACLTPLFHALAGKPLDTIVKGENLMLFDPALAKA